MNTETLIFTLLELFGGLCLFLFGMSLMGDALERRAGGSLKTILGKLTGNKFAGLLTGLGVTSIIQSSSATTVMVVGFVNSGLMTLKQAINVIMGANIGTTVTAWILSLGGISGDNIFLKLLKPTSFTPVLALIGIVLYMFFKSHKKKDVGVILLGFAVLMFGMDAMTNAVEPLAEIEAFRNMFLMFKDIPILGVVTGAILTAIIQSSSASVGILQALAASGLVSYGAAIPIIMGQNIGTCITAILSSFGTNRNAKRAALVHLSFNVIGTIVWLTVFYIVSIWPPEILGENATMEGIAICHSLFNVACTVLLLPMSSLLEKLAYKLVPEKETPDRINRLDERLFATPAVALERCHALANDMSTDAMTALKDGIACLTAYSKDSAESIRLAEDKTDQYEDVIGSYLVKLSALKLNDGDSATAAKLLKIIGDLERVSDHAVNLAESAEEMREKKLSFSEEAVKELLVLSNATSEIVDLTHTAFVYDDIESAKAVTALEDVIDELKERMRSNHTIRLQQGICSIELGFVWADILTDLERVSDHCANIAGCVLESSAISLDLHSSGKALKKDSSEFENIYSVYSEKYL